jgi:hypothetical protein
VGRALVSRLNSSAGFFGYVYIPTDIPGPRMGDPWKVAWKSKRARAIEQKDRLRTILEGHLSVCSIKEFGC